MENKYTISVTDNGASVYIKLLNTQSYSEYEHTFSQSLVSSLGLPSVEVFYKLVSRAIDGVSRYVYSVKEDPKHATISVTVDELVTYTFTLNRIDSSGSNVRIAQLEERLNTLMRYVDASVIPVGLKSHGSHNWGNILQTAPINSTVLYLHIHGKDANVNSSAHQPHSNVLPIRVLDTSRFYALYNLVELEITIFTDSPPHMSQKPHIKFHELTCPKLEKLTVRDISNTTGEGLEKMKALKYLSISSHNLTLLSPWIGHIKTLKIDGSFSPADIQKIKSMGIQVS